MKERGQKISKMRTRAQSAAANNPTAPVISPPAPPVESLLNATSPAAITPTKEQEELTEAKSPFRGSSKFKTNSSGHLSVGAQGILLKLILDSGGFLFLEKRLNDLCNTRLDLFGNDNTRDPIRRSALHKARTWDTLPGPNLNKLILAFKLTPYLRPQQLLRWFRRVYHLKQILHLHQQLQQLQNHFKKKKKK